MDAPNNMNANKQSADLEAEIRRLRKELDDLRRSTFTSIRDRELQHQADVKKLKEAHNIQLQRVTAECEVQLNCAVAEADGAAADALLRDAREKWEIEARTALARSAEEWGNGERERIAKIKVKMAAERKAAIEERDAYWQAQMPGMSGIPDSSGIRRTNIGQGRKTATGAGTELLLQAVSELLGHDMVSEEVHLEPRQGDLRAAFYNLGAVQQEDYGDDGVAHLRVRLPRADWNRLMKKGPEPLF